MEDVVEAAAVVCSLQQDWPRGDFDTLNVQRITSEIKSQAEFEQNWI